MTAEIAIINRHAIALATDSAVTVGRKRVWKHTNKLFSLGPRNDIGIMVYNTGDFIGLSWEVVIKEFRSDNTKTKFDTVAECADAFIAYLQSGKIKNDFVETLSVALLFIDMMESLKKHIHAQKTKDICSHLSAVIKREDLKLALVEDIGFTYPEPEFKKRYATSIKKLAKEIFSCRVSASVNEELIDHCYRHFLKKSISEFHTGVVIAGFGKRESFPSILHFYVDGKDVVATRVWKTKGLDFNDHKSPPAVIWPFAQADIFHVFMQGIIPKFLDYVSKYMKKALEDKASALINDYISDNDEKIVESSRQKRDNETIVDEFLSGFDRYRQKTLINPVLHVVQSLPKEEMAAMAEALVEITALRRKVDSLVESVGGPTDVAVISKGDGFVWIKRKHYFDPVLNGDFVIRKENQIKGE